MEPIYTSVFNNEHHIAFMQNSTRFRSKINDENKIGGNQKYWSCVRMFFAVSKIETMDIMQFRDYNKPNWPPNAAKFSSPSWCGCFHTTLSNLNG